MFPRDFRTLKRAKVKKHLETRGKRWANWAAFLGGSWGLFQDLWGVLEGFRSGGPASLQNSPLPALWCNRFLGLLANFRFKGILRGFLWVYRCKMYIRSAWGFRGACGALCV